MREILFRGKTDKGKWVEGFYCPCCFGRFPCSPAIISKEGIDNDGWQPEKVIPETIGQYTGLTDKNGTKIFEGDIMKGTFLGFPIPIKDYVFSISWQEDVTGYRANYFENVEVIGNIYDTPELLEVKE